jgi:putative oxidoreductase
MKKGTVLEIISFAFILLFLYTSLSKIFMGSLYIYDLKRSPIIGPYAYVLAVLIPASEITISLLLYFNKTRKYGLYGALVLMLLFTAYVGYILGSGGKTPCTCGGIIRELTWKNHLIFNIVFTILAIIGNYLQYKKDHTTLFTKPSF